MVYIGLAFSFITVRNSRCPTRKLSTIRSTSCERSLQGDAFLVQVHPDGAAGQPAHQREIAAVAAHRLDHEAAPGRGAGLPDPVDGIDDQIERAVRADREVGVRHVVVDGRRQADHRDLERRVPIPLLRAGCARPRTRPSRR